MVKTYRFKSCKDGERAVCNKEILCFFDTTLHKASLQALVCLILIILIVWSSSARKDLVKLQLAQNRVAHLALHSNQKAVINIIHASLSWLRVKERLTASLLLFIRNINVLEITNCLQSQDTHTYPTSHQSINQIFLWSLFYSSRCHKMLYRNPT